MKNRGRHDIIVIGGSAGALEPLRQLLELLPTDLPAVLLVTLHIPADYPSVLPELLSKPEKWTARHPDHREKLKRGMVYVAPPNAHLVVNDSRVELGTGPRENRHRPAIDVMFRTTARSYGPRVAAVVLSGQLDDGSAGLMAVKVKGGLTIVQDPSEALAPEMPNRAIQYAGPDYVLPVQEIAQLLVTVSSENLSLPNAPEPSMSHPDPSSEANLKKSTNTEGREGRPSAFACPDCHGVLWEVEEGHVLRFRCRVGHAYTSDSLRAAFSDAGEDALWVAMRTLEERASLLRRLANRSGERMSAHYLDEATGFDRHAETIRQMLTETRSPYRTENEAEGKGAAD
jgi:two-component system chemotaxis response regulator CheB